MPVKRIKHYFPELNIIQLSQLEALGGIYTDWNARINVISRKDMDHFYERHVMHSMGISKVVQFAQGSKILDVGTGGGFPGIPLAIMFPDVRFHLIDSIGKKIMVVEEVVKALGLENVTAEKIRAEQVTDKYDFVVSRAVTRMKPFIQWIRKNIRKESINEIPNGVLYLKGGDLREELNEIKRGKKVYQLADWFDEPFFETKKIVHVAL